MTTDFILPFEQIRAADLPRVGGKGANLGEMAAAGFPIPPGFCLTTSAFQHFMNASGAAAEVYTALEALPPGDVEGVRKIGQQVRETLLKTPMPAEIETAMIAAWQAAGDQHAYAVRSSATAEDLPDASFAGQQDTYLNVRGKQALLDNVRACWASLFTDRAILYRAQNGFSHRDVYLSVVVQRMVLPEVSGIMFTADPVSNHRQIISIDASYGLGEALVAGLVSPDLYRVDKRSNTIIEIKVADKKMAIRPKPEGGTFHEDLGDDLRHAQVLTEEQIRQLAALGAKIEAHYGKPQDIEWALADGELYVVQSRPITSLFPLPAPLRDDGDLRIFMSFSHAQVMTDPMPPMGISIWRIMMPFGKRDQPLINNPYVCPAAGRVYVDVSPMLRVNPSRFVLPRILTVADRLIASVLGDVMQREEFQRGKEKTNRRDLAHWLVPLFARAAWALLFERPEETIARVSQMADAFVSKKRAELEATAPGIERLKAAWQTIGTGFIQGALPLPPYLMAAMFAKTLLEHLTRNYSTSADHESLMRGLSGNVTTEMDLEVGDLADVARQSPALVEHLLKHGIGALDTAANIEGGPEFLTAWNAFLERYGSRGPSEIDVTRPRWRQNAGSMLQVVIGNIQHSEMGAHRLKHRQLIAEGDAAGQRLVAAARTGLFGGLRAAVVQRLVRVMRHNLAMREHPKFMLIQVLYLVREAILENAEMLLEQSRIDTLEDVWFLEMPELVAALENPADDLRPRIAQRRADLERFKKMTPPRVITSDGEIPVVKHHDANLPDGALPGSAVSAGVIEGIARVVRDPHTETLNAGEILVAPFTDPGWTPLFINAAGLVMEVGGLMTHGSVIAREYGIPAVVGVLDATRQIKSGQRIRVQGDLGYVEILADEPELVVEVPA